MKGGQEKWVQSKLLTPDCDTCWGWEYTALLVFKALVTVFWRWIIEEDSALKLLKPLACAKRLETFIDI